MTKPFAKWCVCIALSCLPSQVLAADPNAAAQDAAAPVMQQFGSTDGIRQHASLPLTSEDTQLSSIDGSQSASARISNPASSAFLTVFIQPSATGDLQPVTFSQDLDFNGTVDYTYRVPFSVSGICANGVIACDAGTWNNCRAYGWQADAAARASLQEVALDNLGGCYCVNQSCGGSNSASILKDLGGGVAAIIQQRKSGYTISRVEQDEATIRYYGQNNSGSANGNVQQTAYYDDPGSLSGETSATVASQADDPDSYYTMLTASFAVKGIDTEVKTCSVSREAPLREVSLSDIITPVGGTGAVQICGADCIRIILGRIGDDYWRARCSIFEENYRLFVRRPDLIRKATLVRAIWDDHIQVWIGGAKVYNGPNADFPPETKGVCELSRTWTATPNLDVTQYFRQQGLVDTRIRVSVGGAGEGYAFVEIRVNNLCETLDDVITDNCQVLETDNNCRLQEESIDGVLTYHNFNSTNKQPLPETRMISAGTDCTRNITRNWWRKERSYRCTGNKRFDFSDAAKRVDAVTGSLNDNNLGESTFTFTDTRQDVETGTWSTDDQKVEINPVAPPQDCEMVCKTRKPVRDTQAAVVGVTTDYQNSAERYDTLYHVCGTDNTCPTGPGEEIVKDCQCLNEFAEAASIMMVLDEAGHDMTCIDGGTTATDDCLGDIEIFTGKGSECLQNGLDTSFFNCCNDSKSSTLLIEKHCPAASLKTVRARQADSAHYIGTYCKKELPLIGCVQKADVYCLFNSKMGRIIQEQGRVQLQQFNPDGNWGDTDTPNCEGLSPEEFQMLDFSEIDLSEMYGDITPLPEGQMRGEMQEGSEEFQKKIP